MRRGVRVMVAVGLLGLASACHERELLTLTVQAVEPRALEPGTPLRISGDGFSQARACELDLQGFTYRAGATRVKVARRVVAQQRSAHALQVQFARSAWLELGAQGSFDGTMQLRCVRAQGDVAISPRLALRLDLLQPLGRGTAHDRALEHSARGGLERAGMQAADGEPTAHGIVIGAVQAQGPAARAGLRPGDRIVRAGGVGVHALRDLAPTPHERSLDIHVYSFAARKVVRVVLELDPSAALKWQWPTRGSLLAGLLLGCAVSSRRLRAHLAQLWLARPRDASRAPIALWGGRPRSTRARDHTFAPVLLPAVLSAGGALVIYLEPPDFLALRSLSLYLGFAALSAVLTFMHGRGSRAQRRRAALELLGRLLVLGIVVACACAASGTKALDGIVAEQGGWPWTWSGARKPALLLSLPLYIAFASELGAATLSLPALGGGSQPTLAARLLDRALIAERVVTNIALCALAVVIFAGGWQFPPELSIETVPSRLLGALCFVAKAWLCAAAFAHARDHAWAQRLDPRWTLLGCAGVVASTGFWLGLDTMRARELESFTTQALGVAGALLACGWMVRSLRAAPRPARELRAVAAAPLPRDA